MNIYRTLPIIAMLLALLASCTTPQPTPIPSPTPTAITTWEVEVTQNIPYNTDAGADRRQRLDLYTPAGASNYPVLMFVSGGGWTSGDKTWIANIGYTFAERGIGVALVDHRLQPDVEYSDQVSDLAQAFVWLRANIAEYGGNPERIIVGGHSAGGHLIALLAADSQYLSALGHHPREISRLLLVSAVLDTSGQWGEQSSPLHLVHDGMPPTLLLYGENDFPEMATQAEQMHTALTHVNIPAELQMISGRDHFAIVQAIGPPGEAATEAMMMWMASAFN